MHFVGGICMLTNEYMCECVMINKVSGKVKQIKQLHFICKKL